MLLSLMSDPALAWDNSFDPTCFPIAETVKQCLAAKGKVTAGRSFLVEEASVCDGGHPPMPPPCHVINDRFSPDVGVDWNATVDHLETLDPEVAARFALLRDLAPVPIPTWDDATLQVVLQEVVDAVHAQAPWAPPATLTRYEGGFRIVASSERLLEQVADLDRTMCPEAAAIVARRGESRPQPKRRSGQPTTWWVEDAQRCALARFAERGIRIPNNPNMGGGHNFPLLAADDRTWHEVPLWQLLDEFFRGYGAGDKGYLLMIQDAPPQGAEPGEVPTRRTVRLWEMEEPPPYPELVPL